MKAKTAMWRSADGRVSPIRDLETEHLQNLAAYLQRRATEHDRISELATANGLAIGPLVILDEPVSAWLLCIINELSRRRAKELAKSLKTVETLKGTQS